MSQGDFGAISRLSGAHKVAANNNDCVAQYLNAGGNQKGSDLDIEAPVLCLMKPGGSVLCRITLLHSFSLAERESWLVKTIFDRTISYRCDCGENCHLSVEVLNSRVKDVLRVKARLGLIASPKTTYVAERPVPASDSDAPNAW